MYNVYIVNLVKGLRVTQKIKLAVDCHDDHHGHREFQLQTQTANKDHAKPVGNPRPSWDETYMAIANEVAKRSTCMRAHVGTVITKDNQILSTGYNGAPKGQPHCYEAGCLLEDGHCIRAVHAEMNAIVQCAQHGTSTAGATLYVTHFPCQKCMPVIVQSGITAIVFHDAYRVHQYSLQLIDAAGIKIYQI